MFIEEAKAADISGDIPVNSSKIDNIYRFGSYKRKNSPYF
jgi:hypothetical protein